MTFKPRRRTFGADNAGPVVVTKQKGTHIGNQKTGDLEFRAAPDFSRQQTIQRR